MTAQKTLRILRVEDDDNIRFNAVEALTDAGFEVLEAEDGDKAMALIQDPDSVDLVFTDVTMPGKWDGVDLVEQIRLDHPTMPFVVTSGFALNLSARLSKLTAPTVFINKPYSLSDVVATLEKLLPTEH
jgi:DNA-binding NtrC family response regulator